jgi:acetoin utilization deacetylase AcuC-like enzyme
MHPKPTAIVIDPRYAEHDPGAGHPERPARIATLIDLIDEVSEGLDRLSPRAATGDELSLVHDPAYVEDVARTQDRDWYAFDPDTTTCARSFETARLAAGGFLELLDAVMEERAQNGFAFVRPPGHHAERQRAMGFCLFNNVAVGAAYLRAKYGLERLLVVDWDLHHGNGTQRMFEGDPQVLYVSTHQYPYYPGTGAADETGRGEGPGFTVNVPLPAGCGDADYVDAFRRLVVPIAQSYEPQFVLVSAGFDAHVRDPLGDMQVTEAGFRTMARMLLEVADEQAQGRCAAILEGGYDLQAIRSSSAAVIDEMRGADVPLAVPPTPARIPALVDEVRKLQKNYWKL